MGYLSAQIEALAKKTKKEKPSLVKREFSCGIFQNYGTSEIDYSDKSKD